MINAFGFVKRQSSYYRQAEEILGLVEQDKNKYKLTSRGEEYLRLATEKKSIFICKLLLEFPLINDIFIDISTEKNKVISKQQIIEQLEKKSHLSGSTLGRQTQTIISWFKWIKNNLGVIEVDKNGNIKIARQMRLS
jgi:uncharacterized FlgJ-related protein